MASSLSKHASEHALEGLLRVRPAEPIPPSADINDPRAAAEAAGLRHVADTDPGLGRHQVGKGFRYTWPDGTPLTDRPTLTRIRRLAIPPAYTEVWICLNSGGHLQAVGRDDRGRKQYRYHEDWRVVRDAVKFHRMIAFGEALPRIRELVSADLRKRGLPRDRVLAAVVTMLEQTLVRVGNQEYSKQNQSYGVTTLRNRHVSVRGQKARFRCRKSYIHPTVIDAYTRGYIKPLLEVSGAREEPERSLEEDTLLEVLRQGGAAVGEAAKIAAPRATARRAPARPRRGTPGRPTGGAASWTPRVLRGR